MSSVDESDASQFTPDQKCVEMASMDPERDLDTELCKALGKQVTTEEVSLLGIHPFQLLVGHGGYCVELCSRFEGKTQCCWAELAFGNEKDVFPTFLLLPPDSFIAQSLDPSH